MAIEPCVRSCWSCGFGIMSHMEHASGVTVVICANCDAPLDVNDTETLDAFERIARAEGDEEGTRYAASWRAFLRRRDFKVVPPPPRSPKPR
jgi:hypothetical protein